MDTVNHLHAQAVSKLPTGVELVGDTPFLLLATVCALAGVYDVAKAGQVKFGRSVIAANSKALLEASDERGGLESITWCVHMEPFCADSLIFAIETIRKTPLRKEWSLRPYVTQVFR